MGNKNWPGGRRNSVRHTESRREKICISDFCIDDKCLVHNPPKRK